MKHKNSLICVEDKSSGVLKGDLPYIFVTKFDDDAVTKFYEQFLKMSSNPEIKAIPLVISSYGGQIHSLLSMLDIIDASTKPVPTIALGKAMSCGAVLLACGTKGYRYAAPNADIMIHEASGVGWGKTSDVTNDAKQIKRLNELMFKILQERSSLSKKNELIKKLKSQGNVDWYLSSNEFKKMGLIDHIGVPELLKK